MQVAIRALQPQLVVGDAAQAVGDRRNAGSELPAVADHHAVAAQLLGMAGNILFQGHRADLFFALDDVLQIDRQPALGGNPGLGAFDMREHLAFVVGGAAGVDVAVAPRRFERRRNPLFQRVGRLDIVVTVHQSGRRAGHGRRLGIDQRVAFRGNHFHGKAQSAQMVGHPAGGLGHVGLVLRIGTDAGNPQELAQVVFKPRGMLGQVIVDA